MFQECPRRLFYQSYLAKMGRYPDVPDEVRLAAEMARIKSLDMWAGEVVHQAIQWVLENTRAGTIPSAEEARAEVVRLLSQGWRGSIKQLWRVTPDDRYPNLFEHYYEIPLGAAATERIKDKCVRCISNFMASDIFNSIKSLPIDRWLPIEKFASFRLNGLMFYVKFDFATKYEQSICIYDWKTGNPTDSENRQLACYAMYASDTWDVPIENIKVCAVHLQPQIDAPERWVDESDAEDVREYVKDSFGAMLKCLRNPAKNQAVRDDFPMTENLLRCTRCSFRGICVQGKQATSDRSEPDFGEDWEG